MVYLSLLRQNIELHRVLIGHCLMSNPVHLVVIPHKADGLSLGLKHTHGRSASLGTQFTTQVPRPLENLTYNPGAGFPPRS